MTVSDFNAAYMRILTTLGAFTQTDLAEKLGIKQSSISDAKRRKCIPDSWLVKLMRENSLNPEWVLHGKGTQKLIPAGDEFQAELHRISLDEVPVEELISSLVKRMPRCKVLIEGAFLEESEALPMPEAV